MIESAVHFCGQYVGINRVLVSKYIGQSSLLWCALAIALFAFAWVRVWVVGLFDMGKFQAILELFKEFERFAPIEFEALSTNAGRVGMTFDEPVVILCTVIWCIARGSDVVSGELSRGTLEMLLSQPISRSKLLLSHAFVSVLGLSTLCLVLWAGMGAGIQLCTIKETIPPDSFRVPVLNVEIPLSSGPEVVQYVPMYERVDVGIYAASVFHLFAFGFFLLGLSTLFSSLDRYRWRTIGITMTVYVVQLVMFGLGKSADMLNWLQSLTFFTCYKPQKMTALIGDGDLWSPWSLTEPVPDAMLPPFVYPLILLSLGLVFYLIAVIRFETRDLPAPL